MNARGMNLVVLAATVAVLSSCRDPLRTYQDEVAGLAAGESLHSARPLDLQSSATGILDEDEEPSLEERPDPFSGVERLEVSIEQCRAWTLTNNLDLKVSMIDPQIATTFVSEEQAQFEALLSGRASVSEAKPVQAEVFRDQFV